MTVQTSTRTLPPAKPNGRLGSRKSKTGCVTCKARKVKCDETKPVCKRCINADRLCQGYTDVFVSTQTLDFQYARERIDALLGGLQLRTPSRSPSPVPVENRALHYYQTNIAGFLGGAVDPAFWTRSILQLSEAEPAIRQSLIAISDLWELQMDGRALYSPDAQYRHAELYNKALTATARRVSEPEADTVALATCVIFLCLHCLRGDQQQALRLLQSGSGVLIKVLENFYSPNGSAKNDIAEMFLPLFERLIVLLRLFGSRIPHFRSPNVVLYNDRGNTFSSFEDLDGARSALYWLIAESHELISQTRYYRLSPELNNLDEPALQSCMQKQAVQIAAYADWLETFDSLCESAKPLNDIDEHYQASLRLTHAATFVWLSNCFEREESSYDRYTNSFRLIVQEAIRLNSRNTDGAPPFTFEMGVIAPLFLTVLKCREPNLRLQALSALENAPAREGLWNREEALRVVRRVVDLETVAGLELPGGTTFPDARIVDSRTTHTNEQGTHVIFSAKLRGHEDLWMEWEETIPLQDDTASSPESSYLVFTQAGIA